MSSADHGLVAGIIAKSIANRPFVLFATLVAVALGIHAIRTTPVDALPDLSDVQVTIRTTFAGQAPQIVEDQVTFPVTSALLAVPGATHVRAVSYFGDSFVNVLFEDGTDSGWARSRVLETLAQVANRLPSGARTALGPDATGVGWIYQYALVDRTGSNDLAQLRALQDWHIRFELQSIQGVAEVATAGGMVREYQVVLDPLRIQAYGLTLETIRDAIANGNLESGGGAIEMAEAEYQIRATGYVRSLDDLRRIPLKASDKGVVQLGEVADVRFGPQARRGIVDLDGEGEAVGGIVVMRRGADPREVIGAVITRLSELKASLPDGVEIVETYNRAALIDRAVANLRVRLVEEVLIVAVVCFAFLLHVRSAGVIALALLTAVLGTFAVMRWQGLNANIMSLGGIAIAIGAMVDAAVVMVENVHRKLANGWSPTESRSGLVQQACVEVGPTLFVSLLIVAVSFVPVLALQQEAGRLFSPLAYTKTYAMLMAAFVSVTAVPVLIWYLVRDPIRDEQANLVNRAFAAAYRPVLDLTLRHPRAVLALVAVVTLASLWPAWRLGSEFLPEMDEGDLLYMPVTIPGISPDTARALLQKTDRLIRLTPEVDRVFGKAGRAETATDPAPMEMFETVIRLKPRSQWRKGATLASIRDELNRRLQLPGLANTWSAPIKSRVDMVSTGVRASLGVQVLGPDQNVIEAVCKRVEGLLEEVPGARRVFADRTATGRHIVVDVDRSKAARYGLNISEVHTVIETAIGGAVITEAVEGRERYAVAMRYSADWRDSVERLRGLPVVTARGTLLTLADVARIQVADAPASIRSEDAKPVGYVLVDIDGRDLGGFVAEAKTTVERARLLPEGYSIRWGGQYEHFEQTVKRLKLVIPVTVVIILVMLFLASRRVIDVLLILGSLPFALVGGTWLLWALGYHMSVAAAVGFIALGGLAAQTGMVMLLYLNQAWARRRQGEAQHTVDDLLGAIKEGALLRLRPKLMTAFTVLAGLLPIMLGAGAGSELLRRIAAPMVGGVLSTTVLTLLAIPASFLLVHRRDLQ